MHTVSVKKHYKIDCISAKELADALGISARQCERIIAELKVLGIISRKGPKKTGYWDLKG